MNFIRLSHFRGFSMLLRLLLLIIVVSACRSGEIICPEPKLVKLNKRPSNYRMRIQAKSYTASTKEDKETYKNGKPKPRPVKDAATIEEWDCPKPGGKSQLSKTAKENIKKNKKKIEDYYKSRNSTDSVQSKNNSVNLDN